MGGLAWEPLRNPLNCIVLAAARPPQRPRPCRAAEQRGELAYRVADCQCGKLLGFRLLHLEDRRRIIADRVPLQDIPSQTTILGDLYRAVHLRPMNATVIVESSRI